MLGGVVTAAAARPRATEVRTASQRAPAPNERTLGHEKANPEKRSSASPPSPPPRATSHHLPTDPDRYTLHPSRRFQVSAKRAASLTGARPASLTTRFTPAGWSTGTKSANHRVTTLTTRAQAKRTVDAEDLTQPDDVKKDVKGVYGGAAKLKEGLRRQTVLIYVADETGMINRVAVSLFLFLRTGN